MGWSVDDEIVNCVLNRTYILVKSNRSISDKSPTKYFLDLDKNIFSNKIDQNLKTNLSKHFIDEKALGHIRKKEFKKFLRRRKALIEKYILNKLN